MAKRAAGVSAWVSPDAASAFSRYSGALEYASGVRFRASGNVDTKTSGRKRYHWRWLFVGTTAVRAEAWNLKPQQKETTWRRAGTPAWRCGTGTSARGTPTPGSCAA